MDRSTLLWEGTFGNELLRLLVKVVMEVVSQEQVQEDGFGLVLGVKSHCSQTLHVNCSCLLQDFQQLVNSTAKMISYLSRFWMCTCGKSKFSH